MNEYDISWVDAVRDSVEYVWINDIMVPVYEWSGK